MAAESAMTLRRDGRRRRRRIIREFPLRAVLSKYRNAGAAVEAHY